MAITKYHKFKVSGKSVFPVDMLRYDQCWPADSDSATAIALNLHWAQSDAQTINLVSNQLPTIGRWRSFGWMVV